MTDFCEYELESVCDRLSSGKNIKSREVFEEGRYPVYGGNGLRGYADKENFTGDCAIIGRQGAYCGNVRFFSGTAYMTEHAVVVQANKNHNTRYLSYLLSMMDLGRLSGQSAQPGLSVKVLGKQIVSLPKKEIQDRVADILAVIENKIENNAKINRNLCELAQTIFSEYYESAIDKVKFSERIKILGGGTPKTTEPSYWNGVIPFFTPKDIGTPYTFLTEKYITEDGLSHCNSRLYPANTTFVTARGTVGKVSLSGIPMAMNQSCYALASDVIDPILVYFYTLEIVKSLKHKASGAVFDAIVTRDFNTELVRMLKTEKEKEFLSVVKPVYNQIKSNTIENMRLVDLRESLLPRLMSGELDVTDLEI